MQIFLDSAVLDEIRAGAATGLVDGVTTNPALIHACGQPILETLRQICTATSGPVSAEVVAADYAGMLRESEVLRQIASNIVIKLPLTGDGLRACQQLTRENVKTNVTLCFSAAQGLLAMKSGATYLSPFLGRFAAEGGDAEVLLADLIAIRRAYNFPTKILAASIRTAEQFTLAARLGSDCATLSPKLFHELVEHPMTGAGLAAFTEAWGKTGQSIC